jgi:hypothetical protein
VVTSRYTNLTVVGTVEVLGLGPGWKGEGADGPVSRHVPGLQHETQEGALRAPHQLHIHAPARPHSLAGHLRWHAQGSITRITTLSTES